MNDCVHILLMPLELSKCDIDSLDIENLYDIIDIELKYRRYLYRKILKRYCIVLYRKNEIFQYFDQKNEIYRYFDQK